MNLKTYLSEHKQVDLARKLGVTQGAVHQWAVGLSRPSAERSIQIEKATAGAVSCEVSMCRFCSLVTSRLSRDWFSSQ